MQPDAATKKRWLLEFGLNGFVVLRNFLPQDFVVQLHDQLAPILRGEYEKASKDEWSRGRGTGRLALDLAVYGKLLGGALADERYSRHPVIEDLVDTIFGEHGWRRGWTNVEAAWKGCRHMTWHSDQTPEETPDFDGPHETVRVTYNIPLVDFTWASGAMEIIPGSHRLPRSFFERDSILDVQNLYAWNLDLKRGDAILRDGNGLHRGTPNFLDEPRPMLDQTYKRGTESADE